MPHFAHYVLRQLVQVNYRSPRDPWFASHKPEAQGLERPTHHVTKSTSGPAARVAAGDTIWLFSQLRTPWGMFPPALDARVNVVKVRRRPTAHDIGAAIQFIAGRDSEWFPLFDATSTLKKLVTTTSKHRLSPLLVSPNQRVGRALQSMREIFDAEPLLALQKTLSRRGFEFVSYRLIDGTQAAAQLTQRLLHEGRAVFWDRWSLPRGLTERREFIDSLPLDRHIENQIKASTVVWAVKSPSYAKADTYSWREFDLASRLQKLRWVTTPAA